MISKLHEFDKLYELQKIIIMNDLITVQKDTFMILRMIYNKIILNRFTGRYDSALLTKTMDRSLINSRSII